MTIQVEDRQMEGPAKLYQFARRWRHLPARMTFEQFIAALERGDDPYIRRATADAHETQL